VRPPLLEGIPRVRQLLQTQRFAVLATEDPEGPYASLVGFAPREGLGVLVFATPRGTRKFGNLIRTGRGALLVDDRPASPEDLGDGAALTVLGEAREAPDREGARRVLLARHPLLEGFTASPGCALVELAVRRLLLVTRFQHVTVFAPEDLA